MLPGVTRLLLAITALCICLPVLADESSEEEFERNEIAVFGGITHERRENGLALGAEYKRRLTPEFGMGFLAERTWGDFDFWVFAVPLSWTRERWVFTIAPGVERSRSESNEMLRLAASYEFEVGESKPLVGLAVDFVDGEQVYVLGVSMGLLLW